MVNDFCSVKPLEHCCTCLRPSEGLSLFEFGDHHGVKIEDLKAVAKGGRNYMDWDGDQKTAEDISDALHFVLMCRNRSSDLF
ncbi:hypothetical protein EON65_20520 [archaeon]|nr:MAG: hypothetical protein EON65_20520 [archaeon]